MTWPVIIRPRAEADLAEAMRWYDQQLPGLGDRFLAAVGQAVSTLEEHPERRPLYYQDFRRILTPGFPYKIFYRLEAERVVLFRILHAKRDHPRWLPG